MHADRGRTYESDPAVNAEPSVTLGRGPGLRASVARFPATVLLASIRLYQRTLSPALPVLTLGRCGCRFSPTCSHYAADAIRIHGAVRGLFLAVIRLVKCTPLHPGGLDPVPPRRSCARFTA